MRNRTYGGVRGRKTKVGRKLLRFPPTRFSAFMQEGWKNMKAVANRFFSALAKQEIFHFSLF